MNSLTNHPSIEAWHAWLSKEGAGPQRQEMTDHFQVCKQCQSDVELLKTLSKAEMDQPWEAPPVAISDEVANKPGSDPVPKLDHQPVSMEWTPPDVRSAALGAVDDGQMVVGSYPEAQMSVMAIPPQGEGLWRISGRVWLTDPDPRPLRVVLCLDDHVLTTAEVKDGENFEIEELLGPGWSLEVHLPTGESYELKDPQ